MKVLIVDDYEINCDGIQNMFLKIDANMHIDKAFSGKEAKQKVIETDYDLVLLDIKLPDISGMQVLQHIKERNPNTKVVIISMHSLKQYVSTALDLKASGYLCKDVTFPEFNLAIQKVMNGQIYLSSTITHVMYSQIDKSDYDKLFDGLSESQKQVYPYLMDGKADKEIGAILNKSPKTISTDVYRIKKQMKCKTIVDLIKQFLQYQNSDEY
jgi:DNA-binding NarL/FixJ family response regulator